MVDERKRHRAVKLLPTECWLRAEPAELNLNSYERYSGSKEGACSRTKQSVQYSYCVMAVVVIDSSRRAVTRGAVVKPVTSQPRQSDAKSFPLPPCMLDLQILGLATAINVNPTPDVTFMV